MQLFSRKISLGALMGIVIVSWQGLAVAHPIPDVPVRAWFGSDGSAKFEVELDLRCFVDDPLNEPFVVNASLKAMDEAQRSELKAPAIPFFAKTAKIIFEPMTSGAVEPEFTADFGKVGGGELSGSEDPVAVMLRWETEIPDGVTAYRLEALESGQLSVLFLNHLNEIKQKRMQVLFPGETSKPLDLTNIGADAEAGTGGASVEGGDELAIGGGQDSGEHSAHGLADASAENESKKSSGPVVAEFEPTFEENNQRTLMISAAVMAALIGIGFASVKR